MRIRGALAIATVGFSGMYTSVHGLTEIGSHLSKPRAVEAVTRHAVLDEYHLAFSLGRVACERVIDGQQRPPLHRCNELCRSRAVDDL